MVEVGKYYNTETKKLRATYMKVNEDGTSISKPLYSYWNDSCEITLLCEFIHNNVAIFREFNTSRLVCGVDDIENTSTEYEAIDNANYDVIKKQLSNGELLWVSKDDLHEIAKDTVCNNIEAAKSVNFLADMAEENIARAFKSMCELSNANIGNAKIMRLKKGS